MADGKQWFKVWTSILTDPSMADCHNDVVGMWCRLGALVAQHGDKGTITISRAHFIRTTHLFSANDVTIKQKIDALLMLNVDVKMRNDDVIVTFKKWHKYQVDNSGQRVQKYRENVTVQEEKRREEKKKRKEKKKNTDIEQEFDAFYQVYPRKVGRQAALKKWESINPSDELRKKIMDSLALQNKTVWKNKEPEYIPHPATWLNQGRWEDEIKAPPQMGCNLGPNMFGDPE